MERLELHPLCTLFPRLNGAEFKTLCEDIRANGLRQPIVMHDGMILDGGNRYRACVEAGVKPTFAKFGGGNLVDFVLSANLHRRHMTPGQQAAIVASAQDWAKAQQRGGDRKSDQSATLHFDQAKDRAATSGASLRTQKMADKVAKKSPALAKKVAHGEMSLPKAHKQISKPSKILPRPEPKTSEAKPAPLEVARDHAKKQNAAIKELRKQVAERDSRIEALSGELREARDNARELADSLDACMKSGEGEAAAAKEIKRLLGVVRVLESQRDQYMTKANELVKTVKSLQAQIAKAKK
jgi:hypothetical protein